MATCLLFSSPEGEGFQPSPHETIKELLSKTTFHNVREAKNIYKIVGIEIDLSGIECFINKRHDFVHRNGKDKDGQIVKTSKEEIINIISIIKNICENINNQALHLNYAS